MLNTIYTRTKSERVAARAAPCLFLFLFLFMFMFIIIELLIQI